MKNKEKIKKLIEKSIEEILLEEGIIDPFARVGQAITNSLKRITTVTVGNIAKVTANFISLINPFITNKEAKRINDSITQQIKSTMSQHNSEYDQNVNQSLNILMNPDINLLTFIMNPQAYLALGTIAKAPGQVINALDILTMGKVASVRNLKSALSNMSANKTSYTSDYSSGGGTGYYDDYGDYGGIYEQSNQQIPNLQQQIKNVFNDPNVINAIKNNPSIRKLLYSADYAKLNFISNRATQLNKIKNFDQLKNFMAEDFEQLNSLINIKLANLINKDSKLNIENKEQLLNKAKEEAVKDIKTVYKNFYINYIKNNVAEQLSVEKNKLFNKINSII